MAEEEKAPTRAEGAQGVAWLHGEGGRGSRFMQRRRAESGLVWPQRASRRRLDRGSNGLAVDPLSRKGRRDACKCEVEQSGLRGVQAWRLVECGGKGCPRRTWRRGQRMEGG